MDIILLILVVIFAGLTIYAFATRKKINLEIQQQTTQLTAENEKLKTINSGLYETNTGLYQEIEDLHDSIQALKACKQQLDQDISNGNKQLSQLNQDIQITKTMASAEAATQHEITKRAFETYCDQLDKEYDKIDEQYSQKLATINHELEWKQKQLDEIAATRAAAHQALLKEQEVRDNKDNYRLLPSRQDLEDVKALERVKLTLHKPRILSMLIWQTYWQPLAKTKFPIILQNKTQCGIYKITNLQTTECYIGQSVDIYKRWNEHCKCGLGIDTPPGNKLYLAMQEWGLENFTFELLIACSKEELNSKEKYFIELYQAKEYGYNGTAGNN